MNIEESIIKRQVKGKEPDTSDPYYKKPLKTKQWNIGSDADLKMAIIGDYWDEETVTQVVDLLRKYEDLFPKSFSEMKIELKPEARPIKKRPYRFNPKSKAKVKRELDRMLAAGIIFPVEES